jgi:hypothetical protein
MQWYSLKASHSPIVFCLALFSISLTASAAEVTTGADKETGLKFWDWQAKGVQFRITQRLPDQTRAFFLARGFDARNVDELAVNCVFQSMFKNIGQPDSGPISIDLTNWRVITPRGARRVLTREYWMPKWEARQLSQPARIAFEWSLIPTKQVYEPGDYNWGMTSYGLPPGTHFDLEFSWRRNNKIETGLLRDVICPADIHPEPTEPQ